MPNRNFGEYEKGLKDSSSWKQGPERVDATGQRANKTSDAGGNMPMKYATADWKMPGNFKQQPRDRTWGMRQADGNPYDVGLAKPESAGDEMEESLSETPVERGSVNRSKSQGHMRGSLAKSTEKVGF